ncbi:MAG: DPP IV N-terminal domain-containing protein [Anaerolineae bacterium]
MSALANPYVTDSPVFGADLFVGRSDVLGWLQDSMDAGMRVLAVCGPRQVGKSSVLAQLRHRLLGAYAVLWVPCRDLPAANLADLLFAVAERVAADLREGYGKEFPPPQREAFASDLSALAGPFWARVRQVTAGQVPVLVLDDFETFASRARPDLVQAFLDYLQRLLERDPRLRLIFSAQSPAQLRALHPTLFARLLWRSLGPLSRQEALRLIKEPVEGAVEYDYEALERILELSSRWPAYIQRLCRRLVDLVGGRGYVSRADVDQAAEDLAREGFPEFEDLWAHLAPDERIVVAAVGELRGTQGLATRQDLLRVLRGAGLDPPPQDVARAMDRLVEKEVLERLGALSCRFPVYLMRTWVQAQHPLAQVLVEEKWPRALPERRPSRVAQGLVTLAVAAAVVFFAWRAWPREEPASAPATPPPAAPATVPPRTPTPQPAASTPTAPPETAPATATPLTLPPIPTRGYVFVRSLPAIAYMSRKGEGPWQVWVMTSDGKERFPITDGTTDDSAPVWSPDGNELLFVSRRDGNREIYRISLDAALAGQPPTNLTRNRADDWTPSWSPDGQFIAFSSMRDGDWDIYVMRADGSEVVQLTDDPAPDISPDWSPDGQRIAFASKRSGNWDLYIMNRDGSDVVQITDHPASDLSPDWSPDGSRIAFETTRDGDAEIYIMWADGYELYNLTQDPTANDHWPTWSPDGSRIAFCSNREGNWEVYTLDIDGRQLVNLTRSPETQDQGPAWRP